MHLLMPLPMPLPNITTPTSPNTGWVRDKLLGLEPDDIDIAIDQCAGETFANQLKLFMESEKMNELGTIATIALNPEKSKHLETATAKLFGQFGNNLTLTRIMILTIILLLFLTSFLVDFVHLRTGKAVNFNFRIIPSRLEKPNSRIRNAL